ncbi:MAG: restriction endonuclease subunit S [Pseudomonadota bacterium]|nr:restriction endonuclease subunit S [Pseudomonadota bacterium]
MRELPEGWAEATLGDVTTQRQEKLDPKAVTSMPFLGMDDVESASGRIVQYKTTDGLKSSVAAFEAGDLLFGRLRPYLKKVVRPEQRGAASAEFIVFEENEGFDLELLKHLLLSEDFLHFTTQVSTGDRPRVSYKSISGFEVMVPPAPEQKRIAAKIDSLTAKSARARTELAKIEALVERYKAAIYLDAFTTAPDQSSTGELNDWTRLLSARALPPHWARVRLGDIAEIQSGIALGKKRRPDQKLIELPYLRVANVQRGHLNLTDVKSTSVTEAEAEKLLLQPGDILMNEGGDRDKLGRGWVWSGEVYRCIHQNHVFRVRLKDRDFPPKYISHFANEFGKRHFFDEGTQTTNLASISKTKLSQLPVAIPPAHEAKQIVLHLERRLRFLDTVRQACHDATQMSLRLDCSILTQAFNGQLVLQSPDDEPAIELLARIKAARDNAPKKLRQGGKGGKTKVSPIQKLNEALVSWPDAGLTFDELRKSLPGSYEAQKDAIFGLLSSNPPKLRQEFDENGQIMKLKKV